VIRDDPAEAARARAYQQDRAARQQTVAAHQAALTPGQRPLPESETTMATKHTDSAPEPSAANTRAVTDEATDEVVASVTDTQAAPPVARGLAATGNPHDLSTPQSPRLAPAAPAVPPGTDVGQDEVQAAVNVAEDQGYLGTTPDPTPDSAYTVAGVIAGEPTPETAGRDLGTVATRTPVPPRSRK
jgi:hypothetical protein